MPFFKQKLSKFNSLSFQKILSDPFMSKASQSNSPRLGDNPIAIIGMSALFPQAEHLGQYWNNIVEQIDSIIEIPESRWKIEDYFDEDQNVPDKSYSKRGGFIPDVDFNPMDFGIPPNILEVTDSSQLLGLLTAKNALEDSGYGLSLIHI